MPFEDPLRKLADAHEAKRTATCPVCGRRYVPLKSGKVRKHSAFYGYRYTGYTVCPGAGKPEKKG